MGGGVNCPTCTHNARRLSGGHKHLGNRGGKHIAYFQCLNEDCETGKFSENRGVVSVMTDEPCVTFKSNREALRVLREAVRDDREWFGEITDETRALVGVVLERVMSL
jgi:hypothetical protein